MKSNMAINTETLAKKVPGYVTLYEIDDFFQGSIIVEFENTTIGYIYYNNSEGSWCFNDCIEVTDSKYQEYSLLDLIKELEKNISESIEFKVIKYSDYKQIIKSKYE